ncbi:MBL fold metallo-hydrolase [Paenibacillus lentus]|uniref:MBL fold metallo-hydrolase n=1 Tax=Paenibacillus lentus TaxID=1338368 RepID=A0A3Q8S4D8_9BACL|nr:MBL fold metallo-hydrolase [Paenibacillus lentus]AZK46131.1 MBL fold metallo-hydrolase [Paenibacillus lentus]
MRVLQRKYIWQLTFLPRLFPVNCYLIEEEESITLVDAALPYSAAGISKVIEDRGKPLTRIVLTHAHDDHVGALDRLKARYPEAKVYISEREARLLAGDRSLQAGEPQTKIRGGVPSGVKTRADVLVHEGDSIGSLLVIATPGHTPGSISLLDTRTKALLAGDSFHTRGGLTVTGHLRWAFPFPALATWSKETALASANKLTDYQPTLLATGHGELLLDPTEEMQKALIAARRQLKVKS